MALLTELNYDGQNEQRIIQGMVRDVQRALSASVSDTGRIDEARRLFGALKAWCRCHFNEEELVMARIDHPGLASHAQAHEELLSWLQSREEKIGNAGLRDRLARDISTHFLRKVHDHCDTFDLDFARDLERTARAA